LKIIITIKVFQMSQNEPVSKKRILSLDGGGVRGVLTLEILAKIESDLRVSTGKPNLVLADWFDFIGGTSTGAIIASLLSMGRSVEEILEFYIENASRMFEPASWSKRFRSNLYSHESLETKLKEVFGADTELGSEKLKSLLLIVLQDASTDSPWPVTNNPRAKYNQATCGDENNLHIPLWQLVRASTAAPVFFEPEKIKIGAKTHTFIDGGMTPYNNPAFMMFLTATLPQYNLNWPASEEELLLVSVGTGSTAIVKSEINKKPLNYIDSAINIPPALLHANVEEQDKICRVIGKCLAGDEIDSEIGDLIGADSPTGKNAFTYVRYTTDIGKDALEKLGLGHLSALPLKKMDDASLVGPLREIGSAVAHHKVDVAHLNNHCPFQ
jgi:patatin-like phospholipase/acyl hydrolase